MLFALLMLPGVGFAYYFESGDEISLVSKTNKIKCDAYAPLSTTDIAKKTIEVRSDYAYMIEKPVSFTVTGVR